MKIETSNISDKLTTHKIFRDNGDQYANIDQSIGSYNPEFTVYIFLDAKNVTFSKCLFFGYYSTYDVAMQVVKAMETRV